MVFNQPDVQVDSHVQPMACIETFSFRGIKDALIWNKMKGDFSASQPTSAYVGESGSEEGLNV